VAGFVTLLLDAGNSRLKWALVRPGATPLSGTATPDASGLAALARELETSGVPGRIALINVRGDGFADLVSACCVQQGWPPPVVVRPARSGHGLEPAYADPRALGADRYAAMVAARHLFRGPVIVVDCGTAVTVDAVDASGRHLGGLIMPGLSLMRRALADGTAALPTVTGGTAIGLGRNTVDAMSSGTVLGLAGAVDGLCRHAADIMGNEPQRVLTGGDAELIRAHGRGVYAWRPWLVFQGAYFIMEGDAACDPWRSC
jgi:type III pantothenate kinase